MVEIFWTLTLVLSLMAMALLLPWLKFSFKTLGILICIPILGYALYYHFGSSHYLENYYSLTEQRNRNQMQRIRPLMTELKKQEYRFRFYLEENPKDVLIQSQLLELLAIQALQAGDSNLAQELLLKALAVLPKNPKYFSRKQHILELLKSDLDPV